MIFVLDTNAVSDCMREHPGIETHLAALGRNDTAAICTVVRGEILFGIARVPLGRYRSELEQQATKVLPRLFCFAVPESAGDLYASTKLSCQRKGIVLDENDLWIAATALALRATVVTRDKDFAQVDGLTVEDWTL
jgi:predicted nucleic acid-binding protein